MGTATQWERTPSGNGLPPDGGGHPVGTGSWGAQARGEGAGDAEQAARADANQEGC